MLWKGGKLRVNRRLPEIYFDSWLEILMRAVLNFGLYSVKWRKGRRIDDPYKYNTGAGNCRPGTFFIRFLLRCSRLRPSCCRSPSV